MTRIWLLLLGALATVGFAFIVLVAVPGVMLQDVPRPAELKPYTPEQARGRAVYIANGCIYCHSQQVRDPAFTTDVQRGWGNRATVPADYVYDRPNLLGTMRTGPDLINVGQRLPDVGWQLLHLYNPRTVAPWSIMPAYPYLFAVRDSAAVRPGERVVTVPGEHAPPPGRVVVATPDALALAEYLISLKRDYPVPQRGGTGDAANGRSAHTMP